MEIDKIDRKIIAALSEDGRMPITELSTRVGLSTTPCRMRLARLEKDGFILGYGARINHKKLEQSHICFVEVKLEATDEKTLAAFNAAVNAIPEIEQAHMIAGNFDYLLKVRTRNIDAYRQVLGEAISTLPAVHATSTNVSMQSVKENSSFEPDSAD